MTLRHAAAAIVGVLSLAWGAGSAYAREPIVNATEQQLLDPALSDAARFGRFVDRSPRARGAEPAPVAVTIEDLSRRALPLAPREARPRSPYRIQVPQAPSAPAVLAERVGPGPVPTSAGLARTLAQYAGMSLIVIGLTGPFRRGSSRRRGGSYQEELPPISV